MAVTMKQKKDYKVYCSGDVRGSKINYKDGVGYCIWHVMKPGSEEDEDVGLCFDFSDELYPDTVAVLSELGVATADEYVPDVKYEEFKAKREQEEKTLWWKIKDKLEDFGVTFTPFYWRFKKLFISRPVGGLGKEGKEELMYKMCGGCHFGPFTFTW